MDRSLGPASTITIPLLHEPLNAPGLLTALATVAAEIGYILS